MAESPEIEQMLKMIPIDENYLSTVAQLNKDGWQINPSVVPIAAYHLIRIKNMQPPQAAAPVGIGTMGIDDSKVFVIPAEQK